MSNDILEDQLRDVLARDAERAPIATLTSEQLQRRARAMTRTAPGRRARWAFGIAAAATAGVAATVLGLTSSDGAPAFASWVSTPSRISPAAAAALSARCDDVGVTAPDGTVNWPLDAAPAIIDRRGHSAYAVYSVGDSWVDCLETIPGLTPDRGLPEGWLSLGSVHGAATTTADDAHPVALLSVKDPEGNDVNRAPVTWVSGRVAADVARVRIDTSNGAVEATVRDGLFAAWWPGNDADSDVIRAYDRAGHLLATLDELTCDGHGLNPRVHLPDQASTGGC